jgi:3-oxoadipate enol-lactonase
MPHIDVNGLNMFYEEVGDGDEPLLFISGLGANRSRWEPITPYFDKYKCFIFDNRGVGRTDVPPGPYTMEQLGHDTAGLIEKLGIGPVKAMGWSMGGVVMQSLLIDHPETVSRAAMVSTLPCYTNIQHAWLDAGLTLRAAGVDPVVLGASGQPWGFTPYMVTDHDALFRMLKMARDDPEPTSNEGYAAQAQGIRTFDRRSELSGVQTPTLVLVGAEDVLTPPAQSIEIAERMPNAKLQILPRGGHAMMVEFPQRTTRAVKNFLAAG